MWKINLLAVKNRVEGLETRTKPEPPPSSPALLPRFGCTLPCILPRYSARLWGQAIVSPLLLLPTPTSPLLPSHRVQPCMSCLTARTLSVGYSPAATAIPAWIVVSGRKTCLVWAPLHRLQLPLGCISTCSGLGAARAAVGASSRLLSISSRGRAALVPAAPPPPLGAPGSVHHTSPLRAGQPFGLTFSPRCCCLG